MAIVYQPMYRVHGTSVWTNFGAPITTTTVTITGLTGGTAYDFEVQASNSFGSATSNVVQATTLSTLTINSIGLTGTSFTAGAAIGTVIGSVNVSMSSGSFTGSLALSGTDAGFFQLVSGQLQVAVSGTTARNYSITITATQSGASNSPFPQAFSLSSVSASQEAAEGLVINTVGPVMNASTSAGTADPSGPWDVFSLVATNNVSINLSAPGQSAITTTSNNVLLIAYGNHTCFQKNNQNRWWFWDTTLAFGPSNWVEYGVSTVNVATNTYAANAPANTVVGTISVSMISGGAFTGTLLVSDPTNSFKIVGNQLQASKTLSQSSYPNVVITANPYVTTDASHLVIGEVGTQTAQINQTGVGPTAPAIATNAGYHTLLWSDDFTTQSVATSSSQGFGGNTKWWWGPSGLFFNGNVYNVQTTMTASTTPLGIGAGSNASPNGGILVLTNSVQSPSGAGGNSYLMSMPNNVTSVPSSAQGAFNKVYIEAYIAYDPANWAGNPQDFSHFWFPAFWSWTAEGVYDGRFGLSGSNLTATSTEIDFMEDQSNISFGGSPDPQGWNTHGGFFPGGGGTSIPVIGGNYPTSDKQWHTFGFLWDQSNNISFYKDGTQSGSTYLITNTNGSFGSQHLFLILGTGTNWPMYIDWVRVWGLP